MQSVDVCVKGAEYISNKINNLSLGPRPHITESLSHNRSINSRQPLPPGNLINLDLIEREDRQALLHLAAEHGPIFKAQSQNRVIICVVGLEIGRRLLMGHTSSLQPITIDLKALFSAGFMRQMKGDDHRKYRDALVRGIHGLDEDDCRRDLEIIIAQELDAYLRETGAKGSPQEFLAALATISCGMLCRVFFGAVPGTERLDRLLERYRQLGPHGIVWNITERQIKNFGDLRDELCRQPPTTTDPEWRHFQGSLLGRLTEIGAIDDTLLGNLIYMVEMGRYDMRGLFRWISKYAAETPSWIDRIVAAEKDDPVRAEELSRSFVLETLRMDQSERLMRNVERDFVFDDFAFPKGAILRICLWEAHKDGEVFQDPFVFDPSRFLVPGQSVDGFSPFGLDHHYCPFSTLSVTFGATFLRTLARKFHVAAAGSGPAIRGVYHWEPPRSFALPLRPRGSDG